MTNYFSSNLKYLRKKQGKNRSEMAVLLNITDSTLGNYEANYSKPKFDDLLQICQIFGINLTDLVERDLSQEGKDSQNLELKKTEKKGKGIGKVTGKLITPLNTFSLNERQLAYPSFNIYDIGTDRSNFDISALVSGDSGLLASLYQPQLGEGLHVSLMLTVDTMQPTIQSGDKLLATHITDLSAIRPGHIYILVDNTDGIVCGRISQVSKTDLTLMFDNELYPTYKRPLKSITSIFKVHEVHTTNLSPSNSELHKEIRSIRKELSQLQALLKKKSK